MFDTNGISECLSEFPDGFCLEDDTCKLCRDSCEVCSSLIDCKKYKSQFYLIIQEGKYNCVESVAPGYYSKYSVLLHYIGECIIAEVSISAETVYKD